MFDSVLSRPSLTKARLRLGGLLSIALHAAAIAAVAWFTSVKATPGEAPTPDLKFLAVAPRRQPASAASAPQTHAPKPKRAHRALHPPSAIPVAAATVTAQVSPPSQAADDEASDDVAEVGALLGDGPACPVSGPTGGTDVVDFGIGMTRPECDKSALADIYRHSRAALEARVEGSLILQCNIMADGSVQTCRALKGLPHLTEAALAAMGAMKCKPATFQGRSISIRYIQNFQFTLP
jgi:periplasmic protein TonB